MPVSGQRSFDGYFIGGVYGWCDDTKPCFKRERESKIEDIKRLLGENNSYQVSVEGGSLLLTNGRGLSLQEFTNTPEGVICKEVRFYDGRITFHCMPETGMPPIKKQQEIDRIINLSLKALGDTPTNRLVSLITLIKGRFR